jgi:hypothetical protein
MLYIPDSAGVIPHTRRLETAEVLRRICVRPPYFALRDLTLETAPSGQVLMATVSAENTPNKEIGPIQGAELSRHAAIAGLCAAASTQADSDRRYYLARQAWYEGFENRAPYGTPIQIRAEILEMDKRQARALVTATALGEPVCRLEVVYTILGESAFERLFRSRRLETPDFETFGQVPLGAVERDGDAWIRRVEAVTLESCAGHFQNYPAMPVAVLMHQLKNLAGHAMLTGAPISGATTGGTGHFRVVRATVEAADFCWAGEPVAFSVTPRDEQAAQMTFDCTVTATDRRAANMVVTLERTQK